MLKIEFTHNGKRFKDIDDAFKSTILSGYKKIVSNKLAPYREEIEQSGGRISIDFIGDNYDANIVFHDIPDPLTAKLRAALSQS